MTEKKDEDLADLIESETMVDWGYLKANLSQMSTADLIEAMTDLKLYVNKTLALEIAKRDDAVFFLRKLIQDGRHWYQGPPGDAWSPLHAVHVLALIKSQDALELLLDTMRYRGEDLSDWLTENIPALLVAFGEGAVERLKEFSSDETLEAFVRGTAADALTVLAKKYPSYEDEVKSHLIELLNSTGDATFAGIAADALATFHDPSVMPEIRRAFEEGRVDESFIDEEEMEEIVNGVYTDMDENDFKRYTRSPLDHFSRENIEYLHFINYAGKEETRTGSKKEKIGRNEPCPCGSWKKYKKCCMKK
jgi:uncharacterized protein YecA (UPF0149 family)